MLYTHVVGSFRSKCVVMSHANNRPTYVCKLQRSCDDEQRREKRSATETHDAIEVKNVYRGLKIILRGEGDANYALPGKCFTQLMYNYVIKVIS